jgi:hypothetical protein
MGEGRMTAAAARKPARPRKQQKPIYFVVEKLVRPSTGEEVGALVPLTQWDSAAMRARKYKAKTEVRATLTKPRNGWMLRIAHALGKLVIENVEGFEHHGEDHHGAFKELQRRSGICCEEMLLDLGQLGVVPVKQAQSIAYDEMEDEDFNKLAFGICAYIRNEFQGVPPEQLEEIIAKIEAQA